MFKKQLNSVSDASSKQFAIFDQRDVIHEIKWLLEIRLTITEF